MSCDRRCFDLEDINYGCEDCPPTCLGRDNGQHRFLFVCEMCKGEKSLKEMNIVSDELRPVSFYDPNLFKYKEVCNECHKECFNNQ
jgi:hypothetical protein